MKNKTTIDNCIIENIARAAGASLENVLIIVDETLKSNGTCIPCGDSFMIKLKRDWNLRTLAHELKHVEQIQSGLIDFMVAERELTEYSKQWHELEANEFASKY